MIFTINGYTYEFFRAHANGVEVVAFIATNGTESHTEWSAEGITLPRTEEEAGILLNDFDWEVLDQSVTTLARV